MRRIDDKHGGFMILTEQDNDLLVSVEKDKEHILLGKITPSDRLFVTAKNFKLNSYVFSSKLLLETKTFDKVQIGEQAIGLKSLRYNLHIPFGTVAESFTEFVFLGEGKIPKSFKSDLDAMTQMTDFYESYFKAHETTVVTIGPITITDPKKFIEASILTIRRMLSKKQDPTPYFVQLADYFRNL